MITFLNVTKEYITEEGNVAVYDDFSEEIGDGEFVVITGESGSGKTTMLKMLLKETLPQKGDIIVDGRRLSSISRKDIPYYRRDWAHKQLCIF